MELLRTHVRLRTLTRHIHAPWRRVHRAHHIRTRARHGHTHRRGHTRSTRTRHWIILRTRLTTMHRMWTRLTRVMRAHSWAHLWRLLRLLVKRLLHAHHGTLRHPHHLHAMLLLLGHHHHTSLLASMRSLHHHHPLHTLLRPHGAHLRLLLLLLRQHHHARSARVHSWPHLHPLVLLLNEVRLHGLLLHDHVRVLSCPWG